MMQATFCGNQVDACTACSGILRVMLDSWRAPEPLMAIDAHLEWLESIACAAAFDKARPLIDFPTFERWERESFE